MLCPPTLLDTWISEAWVRYGTQLDLKLFYGSRLHTADWRKKDMVFDNNEELEKFLKGLDANDPATAKVVVISSYPTWTARVFYDGKVQTFHGPSGWERRLQELGGLTVNMGPQRWAVQQTAVFLDVRGTTCTDSSGSYSNDAEAKLALGLTAALMAAGVQDVLIMSPYKAQVARCSKLLSDLYPNANGNRLSSTSLLVLGQANHFTAHWSLIKNPREPFARLG